MRSAPKDRFVSGICDVQVFDEEGKSAGSGRISHRRKTSTLRHLGFLDGLRGGAALWVLLGHCMIWGGWYGVALPSPKVAVDVFIVLSGFLMVYVSLEREEQEPIGTAATAVRFWLRRFFRIAPLYYLIIASAFFFGESFKAGYSTLHAANLARFPGFPSVYIASNTHFTLANFLMHISFLFGFFPAFAQSTLLPDWSIGLEMQFYAVFPMLLVLFRRFRPLNAAILIFAAGFFIRKLIVMALGPHGFPEPSFLPLKINTFLVGMLLAMANTRFNNQPLNRALLVVTAVSIASLNSICILALAALIFMMTAESDGGEPSVSRAKGFLHRLLSNRVARFMADVSYGVYLVHGFFISFAGGWLYRQPAFLRWRPVERVALLMCVTVAGSYSMAYILHHLVEKKGIRLGQKIIKRLGQSGAKV
jgi:peptidoglycan/LPS O-acetylase OafA/YrhL